MSSPHQPSPIEPRDSSSATLVDLEGTRPDEEEDERTGLRRCLVPFALLAATFLSTTLSGAMQVGSAATAPNLSASIGLGWHQLGAGLPYALGLMAILVAHEAGHAVAARIHRVPASLPYFLPLPFTLVGTIGAVIGIRGEIRSRNALVDIAAAGPLAGLAVALPVLAYGLHLSTVGPAHSGDAIEGQSLLYLLLKYAIKGELLPWNGRDVQLHPVAFAGWVGLLVTTINLIPIGPLDGGHLAAAALGQGHDRRSRVVHGVLPLIGVAVGAWFSVSAWRSGAAMRSLSLGLPAGLPWMVWSGLLLLLRRQQGGQWREPPDDAPLTIGRRLIVATVGLLFIVLFMPWVMRESP